MEEKLACLYTIQAAANHEPIQKIFVTKLIQQVVVVVDVTQNQGFFLFNNIIFNIILQNHTVSKQLRDVAYSSLGVTSSS